MYSMLVTADTSHFERSWLKADAPKNMSCMLVTADTSQAPMGPCELEEQSPTAELFRQVYLASLSSFSDFGANPDSTVVQVRMWNQNASDTVIKSGVDLESECEWGIDLQILFNVCDRFGDANF